MRNYLPWRLIGTDSRHLILFVVLARFVPYYLLAHLQPVTADCSFQTSSTFVCLVHRINFGGPEAVKVR